jgi:hypothetical protein
MRFGSNKHILKNENGFSRIKTNCLVLNPESLFRSVWNILIIVFVLYTAIYGPYKIAFVDEDSEAINYFESCQDVFFVFDIIL